MLITILNLRNRNFLVDLFIKILREQVNSQRHVYLLSMFLHKVNFISQEYFKEAPYEFFSETDLIEIPKIPTLENLLQFHRQYYHPSQARILLCGGPEEAMPDQMVFIVRVQE